MTVGGVIGHAICTGAAVMGGRHLATHIDERTVQVRHTTMHSQHMSLRGRLCLASCARASDTAHVWLAAHIEWHMCCYLCLCHIDLSTPTLQICGALLFIAFGAHALYTGP